MTEDRMQLIIDAAKSCEGQLQLASTYDRVGDLDSVADCLAIAEFEADYAFAVAARSAVSE